MSDESERRAKSSPDRNGSAEPPPERRRNELMAWIDSKRWRKASRGSSYQLIVKAKCNFASAGRCRPRGRRSPALALHHLYHQHQHQRIPLSCSASSGHLTTHIFSFPHYVYLHDRYGRRPSNGLVCQWKRRSQHQRQPHGPLARSSSPRYACESSRILLSGWSILDLSVAPGTPSRNTHPPSGRTSSPRNGGSVISAVALRTPFLDIAH